MRVPVQVRPGALKVLKCEPEAFQVFLWVLVHGSWFMDHSKCNPSEAWSNNLSPVIVVINAIF